MAQFNSLVLPCLYSASLLVSYALIASPLPSSIRNKLIMSSDSIGQIQGEVIVQSAPLIVKGPPKGFPLVRHRRHTAENFTTALTESSSTARHGNKKKGKKHKGKGGLMKKILPYMFIPAMMSIGFAPLLLTKLKMMVLSAFMVNMMALNAAIFLTLRNMVFGPRFGEHIKYHNFGYSHKHSHSPHRKLQR